MPVEINEVIIRAVVQQPDAAPQPAAPAAADNSRSIQQVLDEVLRKISDKDER